MIFGHYNRGAAADATAIYFPAVQTEFHLHRLDASRKKKVMSS